MRKKGAKGTRRIRLRIRRWMGKKKGIKWKYKWSMREYDACRGEEDKRSQSVWTAWPL
jgi:hypothetical protein